MRPFPPETIGCPSGAPRWQLPGSWLQYALTALCRMVRSVRTDRRTPANGTLPGRETGTMKRLACVFAVTVGATLGGSAIGAAGASPLSLATGLKLDLLSPAVHPGD